jgi:hypothetical protein
MFLLDLNYLFATNRKESNTWYVRPATIRHDEPRINAPSRRRGYDFMASNGKRSMLFQNKANASQEQKRKANNPAYKDYHPWITQLSDTNFQDTNTRVLRKKLMAYDEWFSNGFDAEGTAKLERFVMPLAREAYGLCIAEQELAESERIIRSFEGNLTRAERRRIQRSCGEFKKRK